jgi:hypothetical protein
MDDRIRASAPRAPQVPWRCEHCGREVQAPSREPFLTKAQLASCLQYTTRWVDYRCAEGMPFIDLDGAKRFLLSEVLEWLRRRAEERLRRRPDKAPRPGPAQKARRQALGPAE